MGSIILRADIPALNDYVKESIDLAQEYWSPEKDGESRRMYFMGVQPQKVPDQNDKMKTVELMCAVFVEIDKDGTPKTVANGSIRLVSIVERLPEQTPVMVTYRGKKKNRTNSHQSAAWSVETLKPAEKGNTNGKS